ncbi:MAG: hypothetical protein LUH15_20865 [Tannerellaceae bacterium]|nr:hypothetical protein [Tannerellaceae bacterium]
MIPIDKFLLEVKIDEKERQLEPEEKEQLLRERQEQLVRENHLLEYVWQLAGKYCPYGKINEKGEFIDYAYHFDNQYMNQAVFKFKSRYNNNLLNIDFDYNEYLSNGIADSIKAFGLDIEKYWYAILFARDYAIDYCKNSLCITNTAKEDLEELIYHIKENRIEENIVNFKSIDKSDKQVKDVKTFKNAVNPPPQFKNPISLTLEVGNKTPLKIENPYLIDFIANICNDRYCEIKDKIKDNSLWNVFQSKENKPESDTIKVCIFATMMMDIFNLNNINKHRQKSGTEISQNKYYTVSKIVYFTKLSDNENYEVDKETLKSNLQKFKGSKYRRFDTIY